MTGTRDKRCVRLLLAALFLGAVAYGVVLFHMVEPALAHPDASGYWTQGRLLAETGRTWFTVESQVQYTGMHWLEAADGRRVCRYPPGVPLIIAGVYRLFGPRATFYVSPLLAVMSVVGVGLTLRAMGLGTGALVGAALLAMNRLFTEHALLHIAHMPALCCVVWGVWALLMQVRTRRLGWAALSGFLFGCLPTVRYPEAITWFGVGLFLLWRVRRDGVEGWKRLVVFAAAAALPLGALLMHNRHVYGHFIRTGYALANEQMAFTMADAMRDGVRYLRRLMETGQTALLLLGGAGLAGMLCLRPWRPLGAMLLCFAFMPVLLYGAYEKGIGLDWPGSSGALRFLVPTIPVYVLGLVWGLARLVGRRAAWVKATAAGGLMGLQFLFQGGTAAPADWMLRRQAILADATALLEEYVPGGNLVVSDELLLRHLDFYGRWRLVMPEVLNGEAWTWGQRKRNGESEGARAVLMRKRPGLHLGNLDGEEYDRALAAEIRRWANGRRVFFIGLGKQWALLRGVCFGSDQFRVIARRRLDAAGRYRAPWPPEATEKMDPAELILAEWLNRTPCSG